jgi:acyl-CoA synthetase (AMP-forming)/AMP-acid ligase II
MGRNQGPEPLPFTLAFQAFHNPDKIPLVDRDRRLTFRQLNLRVNRVANALTQQGICRGDRVAVLLHNRAEWVEVMFAMGKLKASSVPVGYRLKGLDVESIVNNSDMRALMAGAAPCHHTTKEVAAGELGELYVKNNMLIWVTTRTRRSRGKVCSTITSA